MFALCVYVAVQTVLNNSVIRVQFSLVCQCKRQPAALVWRTVMAAKLSHFLPFLTLSLKGNNTFI